MSVVGSQISTVLDGSAPMAVLAWREGTHRASPAGVAAVTSRDVLHELGQVASVEGGIDGRCGVVAEPME